MPEDKNYLNGAVIKEHAFDNGGKILKVWVKVDEFTEQLKAIGKNGSANLLIQRRKEPSEKGVTHYIVEDTYVPKDDLSSKPKDDLPF